MLIAVCSYQIQEEAIEDYFLGYGEASKFIFKNVHQDKVKWH